MVHDLAVSTATSHARRITFPQTCLAVVSCFMVAKHLRALQEAPACSRYTITPPRLHQHIKQCSDSGVWFSSTPSESDGGPVSSSRRVVAFSGLAGEKGGSTVVRAWPWEEADWKNVGSEAWPSTGVTSKLNRTLEGRMMGLETTIRPPQSHPHRELGDAFKPKCMQPYS